VRFRKITLPSAAVLLDYELASSWWAHRFSSPLIQTWIGRYFAWKVNRKYYRATEFVRRRDALNRLYAKQEESK
jgi:hypothetical protein